MSLRILLSLALGLLCARPAMAVTAYPYGSLPASAADADLAATYATWKTRHLVAASCGSSLRVDNGGGTVSEGMGYGMLMAAYLDADDTNLTKLWNFYSANFDPNGLMNWSVAASSCSNNGANAATDADLDVAAALIRASRRWPANGWNAKASTLLNNMHSHFLDSCNGLTNGDTWGGCTNGTPKNYNPSYFRTGYLKSFDCYEGGSRWAAVRTQSYNVLNYSYTNYALPPDWVQASGAQGNGNYYYDACRTPWSVGLDYLWWGNATSQAWGVKVTDVFRVKAGGSPAAAAADVGDSYNYSTGAKTSSNHQNEFLGAVGVAAMASAYPAFLDAVYNNLKANDNNSYFSDSLKVIYMMTLTGNFQEPCSGGCTLCTPTFTPTISPTPSNSPTPTPVFSLAKSASVASVGVGVPFTYYLDYQNLATGPDTSGVTPGMTLQFHNSSAPSSGTRANTDFLITNGTGAAVNLSNYRIRYFFYDPGKVQTTDYAIYTYSDGTGVGAGSIVVYPAYTGGPRNANMELRLGFGNYPLNSGFTAQWLGAVGSNGDSWTQNLSDDWSYPGAVGSFSTANAANMVLEENVGGTWKLASGGAYPGGAASIANVTVSDVLDTRLDYVSSQPSGTWVAGTHTFSYTFPSLGVGVAGRITITAQFNGTAAAGNVVPNDADISASGFPSATSNNTDVTVAGAANTATDTVTPTRSATATPSRTATATPTRSSTATSTATVTASSSATPSATGTRTATGTVSPSVTTTDTITPGSSPTFTMTVTATPTQSSTSTRSASPSATGTLTLTASSSATPSASSTITETDTITAGPSPTDSPVLTATPTLTVSPTSTSSATPVDTATPTLSASPSGTTTPTVTFSETLVVVGTFTDTDTRTATPTFTSTVTQVPPGPAPTNTATAQGSGGPNEIESHGAFPNPWNGIGTGSVLAKLEGPVDRVVLRLYTRAMVCVGQSQLGPQGAGWCKLPLPAEMAAASSGSYHYVIQSERGGVKNLHKAVGTLFVLR